MYIRESISLVDGIKLLKRFVFDHSIFRGFEGAS